MKKNVFILFSFFLFACQKDDSLWEIENLNDNKISVFGHGGMGISYREPMNSYPSLNHCISLGAQGTEMDVSVTKDAVMVLYHNRTLEEETNGKGVIKDKTWDEIKTCKYKLPILSKANLIPASYFFDRVKNKEKLTFTFDCKVLEEDNLEYLTIFAEALIKHIEKYDLQNNCFIESFNVTFLKILEKRNNNLKLFLYSPDYKTGVALSKEINLFGLTLDMKKISAQEIKEAHQNNLRITLFNTQSKEQNLEAVKMNPDFIQTDKVDYLLGVLNK